MAIGHVKSDMKEKNERRSERDRDSGGFDKDGDDRGGRRGGRDREGNSSGFHRKKICRFCSDQEYILDYKDARMMQSFMSEHGKIVPRRISGTCAQHQRKLTSAVKRARNLALVGYVSMGN